MKNTQIKEHQIQLLNSRQLFDVELTTRCNKQCYICPRKKLTRKQEDMKLETFCKLLAWLPENSDVYFAGFGEPLLHKDIFKFIKMLVNRNIRVSIMTNAILLDENKIKQLFHFGLHKLQISILKNEEILIDKILNITETKNYNKLQFNLLFDSKNHKMENYYEYLLLKKIKTVKKKIHSKGGKYKTITEKLDGTCGTFFIATYINTIGQIHICSNDINGEYILGNIFSNSFKEIQKIKKKFLGNKTIAPICVKCNDEYRFKHFDKIK
jgi:MoaA/NifB/PqqE/SkfB family radical SAM enzyme